ELVVDLPRQPLLRCVAEQLRSGASLAQELEGVQVAKSRPPAAFRLPTGGLGLDQGRKPRVLRKPQHDASSVPLLGVTLGESAVERQRRSQASAIVVETDIDRSHISATGAVEEKIGVREPGGL